MADESDTIVVTTEPVPNTLTIGTVGAGPGGRSMWTVGVKYNIQPTHSEGVALGAYWAANVIPSAALMQSNTYTNLLTAIHDNLKPEVYSEDIPLTPTQPGNVTNPISASSTAPLISWRTDLAGRSYRGRSYLPGSSEEQVTDDTIDSATTGLLADIVAAVLAVAAFLDIPGAAVVSKHLGTARVLTAGVVRSIIGTQRRRKTGVGE